MGNVRNKLSCCLALALLIGIGLPMDEALAAGRDGAQRGAKQPVGDPIRQNDRQEEPRVLSVKPANGNQVKMRVLTPDGRVRDLVIDDDRRR